MALHWRLCPAAPNLAKEMLAGAGHMIEQERPVEVNR